MSENKTINIPANVFEQIKEEIQTLRRKNEVMSAQLEVLDLLACLLFTSPARKTHGEGEDVLWKLEQLAQGDDA